MELTGRTAKLLTAVLAVLPRCIGGSDLVVAVNNYDEEVHEPAWAPSPAVIMLALLGMLIILLVQACCFVQLGRWWAQRGRDVLELELKVTRTKLSTVRQDLELELKVTRTKLSTVRQDLKILRDAHRELQARECAGGSVEKVFLTRTGEKAHLRAQCTSLRNSHGVREIPVCSFCRSTGPDGTGA